LRLNLEIDTHSTNWTLADIFRHFIFNHSKVKIMKHTFKLLPTVIAGATGLVSLTPSLGWAQTNSITTVIPYVDQQTGPTRTVVPIQVGAIQYTDYNAGSGTTVITPVYRDFDTVTGQYLNTGSTSIQFGISPINFSATGTFSNPVNGQIAYTNNTPPITSGNIATKDWTTTTINNAVTSAIGTIAPQMPVIGNGANDTTMSAAAQGTGNQVAYGTNAVVNAAGGSALGANTTVAAGATNSTAIGNGAAATRPNEVSVGNAAAGTTSVISNVTAGTQGTDAVNVTQLNTGLATTLTSANTYTNTVAASTLSTANTNAQTYANTAQANAIAASNTYTDGRLGTIPTGVTVAQHIANTAATTLTSANTYTDSVAVTTLNSANTYTNTVAAATLATANTNAQTYANTAQANAIAASNTYTDGRIGAIPTGVTVAQHIANTAATTLASANTYTDSVAVTTLNSANTYTDNRIGNIGANTTVQQYVTNSVAAGVASANDYTDKAVSAAVGDMTKSANQGTASAMAMAAVNIAQHAGHFSLGAGVASYGGEQAIAIKAGYLFDSGKTSIGLGIAKSGSKSPTGMQAGISVAF
jgi:YadA-like membrane anchor domain